MSPEIASMFRLFARAKSGHSEYDRGIRDNAVDALRGSQLDPYGFVYWAHRALVQHELAEAGCRYTREAGEFDLACDRALSHVEAFLPWGDTPERVRYCGGQMLKARGDIHTELLRRRSTVSS